MDLGWPEILLIVVVVLIVFGVGKLPQTMKDLGKGVREFRKAQQGDYDDDKKETKALAAGAAAGGTTMVVQSTVRTSPERQPADPQDELSATKTRLEAAEARLRELEATNGKA